MLHGETKEFLYSIFCHYDIVESFHSTVVRVAKVTLSRLLIQAQ